MKHVWERALSALLRLEHSALLPGEVLSLRVLGLSWLLTGHVGLIAEPTFAWFSWSSFAQGAWSAVWILAQLASTCWLIVGRNVRSAAATLSALLLTGFWLSRPYHANNRLFFASLLLCAACTTSLMRWRPMRAQYALLFLGAGLDKLFNEGWRSGAFLSALNHHLAVEGTLWAPGNVVGRPHILARWLDASWVPWSALSWCTIGFEVALGISVLLAPRLVPWLALPLMWSIAVMGGSTMGMFVYLGVAVVLLGDVVTLREQQSFVRLGACDWPVSWLVAVWAFCCGPWFHGHVLFVVAGLLPPLAWSLGKRTKSIPCT